MSDLAIRKTSGQEAFNPATVALMVIIGIVAFFGALVLGTYAPELGQQSRIGSHALANGATGYSGLIRLAAATGRHPQVLRNQSQWSGEDLVVVTPEAAAVDISEMWSTRTGLPTLFVLPKWQIEPDRDHKGWVRIRDLLPASEPEGVFAPGLEFEIKRHARPVRGFAWPDPGLPETIRFVPPKNLQVIARQVREDDDEETSELVPLLTDGEGGVVLGQVDNLYILSDPDLIDNAALKRPENAAAALEMLDWLNSSAGETIGFDVVLNGLGSTRSILRLAFDPPFLAMTLTLAAMALLLGIGARARFGAPRVRARAIAFGKSALVDNSAMLVRKAGKARRLGGRYAAVVRDQAVQAFGVSPRLSPAEGASYLDRLGGSARFSELEARAHEAETDADMLAAAQALHAWKQERLK